MDEQNQQTDSTSNTGSATEQTASGIDAAALAAAGVSGAEKVNANPGDAVVALTERVAALESYYVALHADVTRALADLDSMINQATALLPDSWETKVKAVIATIERHFPGSIPAESDE